MSAAAQILSDLTVRGVRVRPDGELLRLKPKSRLDPDTLAAIKALADEGELDPKRVEQALAQLGIDVDKPNPMFV